MGLSSSSTGTKLLDNDIEALKSKCDFTIAIAGNPNVGKSTVFNSLTGLHQHTGNWPGKTVSNASGIANFNDKDFLLVDIPGTYSIMSNSQEEEIARDYICFGNPDCTVVVLDATCLERNLNLVYQILEITNKVVVCVNLLDEAKKKGIEIDLDKLSFTLGVPVVGTIARKKKTLNKLMQSVYEVCTENCSDELFKIEYPESIENAITIVEKSAKELLCSSLFTNYRWISLKLLEGNSKIISSIENYLNINLVDNENISCSVNKAKEILEDNNINISSFKDIIVSTIMYHSEKISLDVIRCKRQNYSVRTNKIDKILTSKLTGIPIMLLFFALIFWITITGANYPSALLTKFFNYIETKLVLLFEHFNSPLWLIDISVFGLYRTLAWIVAVMLPPMAIFFPLFTILEDLGYLPRIAFNLDNFFRKACTSGKQALTMCMGFGCNAAGVVGCRIIDSPRERLVAMLTNNFVPCNGRFPFLITISSIFFASSALGIWSSIWSTLAVIAVIIIGVIVTLVVSKILSKTILKGIPSSFMLELPPYRTPQFGKILVRSIFDRTLFILGRAVSIAIPAGIIIWLFANINISGISLLTHVANFLDPFAKLMGLDGYILTAFILALPANEIVLPIILMSYTAGGSLMQIDDLSNISNILISNGWTILTAINVMLFCLMHFPCSTTLITIKKESGSLKWTALAFLIPTFLGIIACMFTTGVYNLIF
ncbi:MAG: ferrous iron transport protein B [Clostridia bacterium]|nr:ferrous iron transport protein B [Clostridia bacterium]